LSRRNTRGRGSKNGSTAYFLLCPGGKAEKSVSMVNQSTRVEGRIPDEYSVVIFKPVPASNRTKLFMERRAWKREIF